MQLLDEQNFRLEDIADTAGGALIEEDIDEGRSRVEELSGALRDSVKIRAWRQEVRTETTGEIGVLKTARVQKRHFLGIEADHHVLLRPQGKRCLPLGLLPGFVGSVAMPGAVHPEVAAQKRPVVELKEKVLADRMDAFDPMTNQAFASVILTRTGRPWALSLECSAGFEANPCVDNDCADNPLPDGDGEFVDGVAFGHGNQLMAISGTA